VSALTVCCECAESWPCSVERKRAAYRPEVAALHSPVDAIVTRVRCDGCLALCALPDDVGTDVGELHVIGACGGRWRPETWSL
jgi:hypothetical protein